MPKTPSQTPKEKNACLEEETWAEDQTNRGYYYDDAHGYETYDPAKDDAEVSDESCNGTAKR